MPAERKLKGQMRRGEGFLLVEQSWDPRLGGWKQRCHNGQGKIRRRVS